MRGAGHDLVGAQRDREDGVDAARARPPASMPITSPPTHEPVTSAPQAPKNAPISIMPSSPMLMTPQRSDTMPPSAAKISGVAKRSIAASSADQTNDLSRLPTPDFVARDRARSRRHAERRPRRSRAGAPRRAQRQRAGRDAEQRRARARRPACGPRSAAARCTQASTPSAMPRPADCARHALRPPRAATRSRLVLATLGALRSRRLLARRNSRRPRRPESSTSTSALTSSTTRPWMIVREVRRPAAGSKTVGSRLRTDVP